MGTKKPKFVVSKPVNHGYTILGPSRLSTERMEYIKSLLRAAKEKREKS